MAGRITNNTPVMTSNVAMTPTGQDEVCEATETQSPTKPSSTPPQTNHTPLSADDWTCGREQTAHERLEQETKTCVPERQAHTETMTQETTMRVAEHMSHRRAQSRKVDPQPTKKSVTADILFADTASRTVFNELAKPNKTIWGGSLRSIDTMLSTGFRNSNAKSKANELKTWLENPETLRTKIEDSLKARGDLSPSEIKKTAGHVIERVQHHYAMALGQVMAKHATSKVSETINKVDKLIRQPQEQRRYILSLANRYGHDTSKMVKELTSNGIPLEYAKRIAQNLHQMHNTPGQIQHLSRTTSNFDALTQFATGLGEMKQNLIAFRSGIDGDMTTGAILGDVKYSTLQKRVLGDHGIDPPSKLLRKRSSRLDAKSQAIANNLRNTGSSQDFAGIVADYAPEFASKVFGPIAIPVEIFTTAINVTNTSNDVRATQASRDMGMTSQQSVEANQRKAKLELASIGVRAKGNGVFVKNESKRLGAKVVGEPTEPTQ